MDAQVKLVIDECTKGSDEERLSFSQVVMKLTEVGVEHYHTDFYRAEKTYYMPNGESHVASLAAVAGSPARTFSTEGVESAIRAIQAQKITYKAFCEKIVAAGCVGYFVFIAGQRAIYYGRNGDNYVEPFPSSR